MECEQAMLSSKLGVDRVTQLMSQCCHIIGFTLIIEQNPGSDLWSYRRTKCSTHLSLTDLTIEVVLIKYLACQGGDSGLKTLKCIKYHLSGIAKIVFFLCFNHRCINIIAPQVFHTQPARFET